MDWKPFITCLALIALVAFIFDSSLVFGAQQPLAAAVSEYVDPGPFKYLPPVDVEVKETCGLTMFHDYLIGARNEDGPEKVLHYVNRNILRQESFDKLSPARLEWFYDKPVLVTGFQMYLSVFVARRNKLEAHPVAWTL